MARSTSKVILFSKVKDGAKTFQWPTAVFNNHEDAKTFATLLAVAHKSGDAKTAVAMDPKTALAEDGSLVKGLKFSITEVPYSPTASFGADDMFDTVSPATA
jgi:hypothetical protein